MWAASRAIDTDPSRTSNPQTAQRYSYAFSTRCRKPGRACGSSRRVQRQARRRSGCPGAATRGSAARGSCAAMAAARPGSAAQRACTSGEKPGPDVVRPQRASPAGCRRRSSEPGRRGHARSRRRRAGAARRAARGGRTFAAARTRGSRAVRSGSAWRIGDLGLALLPAAQRVEDQQWLVRGTLVALPPGVQLVESRQDGRWSFATSQAYHSTTSRRCRCKRPLLLKRPDISASTIAFLHPPCALR